MPIDYTYELDKIAEDISKRVVSAYEEVTTLLMQNTEGLSTQETVVAMDNIGVDEIMATKLSGVSKTFEECILLLLENTLTTSSLTEQALRSTLNQAQSYLSQEFVTKVSNSMKTEIVDGIIGNLEPSQVIAEMRRLGYDQQHLETIVRTGYNQYSNAVNNMAFEQLPDNAKFVYVGAYDGITRDNCVKKITFGPATKSAIIVKFGNFNNEVWNCRHRWEEVTNDLEGQGFEPNKTEKFGRDR